MQDLCDTFQCTIVSHNQRAITNICLDPNCKKTPQMCPNCFEDHNEHIAQCPAIVQLDLFSKSLSVSQILRSFGEFRELVEKSLKQIVEQVSRHRSTDFEESVEELLSKESPSYSELQEFGYCVKSQIEYSEGKLKLRNSDQLNILNEGFNDVLTRNMNVIACAIQDIEQQISMKRRDSILYLRQKEVEDVKKQELQLMLQQMEQIEQQVRQEEEEEEEEKQMEMIQSFSLHECEEEFKVKHSYDDIPFVLNNILNKVLIFSVELDYSGNEALGTKNKDISTKEFSLIFIELQKCTSVVCLNVNMSLTNIDDIDQLGKALQEMKGLERLVLNFRHTLIKDIGKLSEALIDKENLIYFELNLSKTLVSDVGELVKAIEKNNGPLQHFNLDLRYQ